MAKYDMGPAGHLSSLRRRYLRAAQPSGAAPFSRDVSLRTALILGLALTCVAFQSRAESVKPSPARKQQAPFSSSLPHVPLPAGEFAGWCGKDDAFLMRHAPGFTKYSLHRPDGHEIATIVLDGLGIWPRCDESAENILFTDGTHSKVLGFNLKAGKATVLISHKRAKHHSVFISLSTNLRYLAYHRNMTHLDEWTSHLDLEHLEINGQVVRWTLDASMLFSGADPGVMPQTNERNYPQTIRIVQARTGQVVLGKLPRGFNLWDGVFINGGKELLLFLKPDSDDAANGTIFKCQIPSIRCRPLVAGVQTASMNERGHIATMKWVFDTPRPEPDSDAVYLPDRSVVRVFNGRGKAFRIAQFPTGFAAGAKISPSGAFVAVSWLPPESRCARGTDSGVCERGVLFDLRR